MRLDLFELAMVEIVVILTIVLVIYNIWFV